MKKWDQYLKSTHLAKGVTSPIEDIIHMIDMVEVVKTETDTTTAKAPEAGAKISDLDFKTEAAGTLKMTVTVNIRKTMIVTSDLGGRAHPEMGGVAHTSLRLSARNSWELLTIL